MDQRLLLLAATLVILASTLPSAEAQPRYRQAPQASSRADYPPAGARPRGPPWSMPNECYIDEGFGRFSPCR